MALHPDFPDDPHAILDPDIRWFPADEALRTTSFEKLLPPLVPTLRKKVQAFRDGGYDGATETSKNLLRWWFAEQHLLPKADGTAEEFQYFFAQREALETIVFLYDVVGVKDKFDLLRFDSSGTVSTGMFDESWRRFVVKMATGAGKTKVLSLVLAWSLPEQTLGRGLRKMYPGSVTEYVSVVGTEAFMDFVESIQAEGVVLERAAMGEGTGPKTPLLVEVDTQNTKKDIDSLDIEIPIMTARVYREYKNLNLLTPAMFDHAKVPYQQFTAEQQREIVFKDITTCQVTHTTVLDSAGIADYRSVIGYFAQTIMKDLRLVSGYDVLYPKVKDFVHYDLFDKPIELEDPNTLRNLSELQATKTIIEGFKVSANDVVIVETKGQEDLHVPLKMARLKQWCDDINEAQKSVRYDFVFVDEEGFKKYRPDSFAALMKSFCDYKLRINEPLPH